MKYILEQGASLVVMSHFGRPKGQKNPDFSMAPIAKEFEKLLGQPVKLASDVIGPEVEAEVKALKPGEVLLLENVRFYKEEEGNDPEFAKTLASYGDVYCNDAFGTAHRAHASTEGVSHYLPSYAGFLIEKEVRFMAPLLENPEKPFVAIIGGSKVSSKITVLESLVRTCDTIVIGGGMAYTFLNVLGNSIGKSLFEPDYVDTAKAFLEKAKEKGVKVILPVDNVCAKEFSETAEPILVNSDNISDDLMGPSCGTVRWASSSSAPSPRAPRRSPRLLQPAMRPLSSVVETRSPPSTSSVLQTRSAMSRQVVVHPSSSSKERPFLASRHWRSRIPYPTYHIGRESIPANAMKGEEK